MSEPVKAVQFPLLTPDECLKILAGLDELQGKHGRLLYDKIVGHIGPQIEPQKFSKGKRKQPKEIT